MSTFQDDVRQARDYPAPVFASESEERIFPAPWSFEQIPQGYRILDANSHVLAYVMTGDESTQEKSGGLSLEEAWRIAGVISSLPDLVTGPRKGHARTEPQMGLTKRSWLWKSMRDSN